jgi:hypothetical protein
LLVKYEIPSIFISSKVIPETRFKYKEFVCYRDDALENKFVFILIPAMYKRHDLKNPEYKLIVNEDNDIKISLDDLTEENCLRNIDNAMQRAMPITKYLDSVFEKRLTTIHPRRKPDAVNIEFVEVSDTPISEVDEGEKSQKIIKQKKGRKLKSKTILEEDEDEDQPLPSILENVNDVKNVNKDEDEDEEFDIELPLSNDVIKNKKKKQSKKRNKGNKLKAYPTRKNKNKENIEFVIEDES